MKLIRAGEIIHTWVRRGSYLKQHWGMTKSNRKHTNDRLCAAICCLFEGLHIVLFDNIGGLQIHFLSFGCQLFSTVLVGNISCLSLASLLSCPSLSVRSFIFPLEPPIHRFTVTVNSMFRIYHIFLYFKIDKSSQPFSYPFIFDIIFYDTNGYFKVCTIENDIDVGQNLSNY